MAFAVCSPPFPAVCAFCHPPTVRERPPWAGKGCGCLGAQRRPQSITDLKTHRLGIRCSPSLSPAAWKCSLLGGFHVGSCGFYGTSLCCLIRRERIKHLGGCTIDSQGCQCTCPDPCPCTPLAANPAGASVLQPRHATASFISNPLPPSCFFFSHQPAVYKPSWATGREERCLVRTFAALEQPA